MNITVAKSPERAGGIILSGLIILTRFERSGTRRARGARTPRQKFQPVFGSAKLWIPRKKHTVEIVRDGCSLNCERLAELSLVVLLEFLGSP